MTAAAAAVSAPAPARMPALTMPSVGSAAATAAQKPPPSDSHYCDGCAPPLIYNGGPVADTTPAAGLTITPIYWIPSATTQFPAGYQSLINGYISNIAAASLSTSNVYSVTSQYYSIAGTTKTFLRYKYTAGTPIVDTQPFPPNGCTPVSGYTNCITDTQLRAELTRLKTASGLVTNLSHFYPVFTAPTVETVDDNDGLNSVSGYCGYHRAFGSAPNQFVYGNEVFEAQGCGEGQSPNNNVPADSSISTLSHEISENVTDPASSSPAWVTVSGAEIGDICGDDYGHPLGSTSPGDPQDTEYNQVINGGKYYTQTEFSNSAYATLGVGFGCQQSTAASVKPAPDPTAPASVFIDATPNAVDADGASTSLIEVAVSNQDGSPTVGDHVQFSEYAVTGSGLCGTMSEDSGVTDADGRLSATYTSSASDAVCAVVAKDALAGKAATANIYQGATQAQAPTATDTFPTSMVANGQPVTFTTSFGNPSQHADRRSRRQPDPVPWHVDHQSRRLPGPALVLHDRRGGPVHADSSHRVHHQRRGYHAGNGTHAPRHHHGRRDHEDHLSPRDRTRSRRRDHAEQSAGPGVLPRAAQPGRRNHHRAVRYLCHQR